VFFCFEKMGVAWVLATSDTLRSVEIALERAGAEHHGSYKVDCTVFKPTQSVQASGASIGTFYLLHHSNFPDSSCSFSDISQHSNLNQDAPFARAISDQGFDLVLQKFSAYLATDIRSRFELNGSEYHLKDFRIRVGTAVMDTTTKGVVVEIEFAPCNVVWQCIGLLSELVNMFFPGEVKRMPAPIYKQRASPENYYVSDTMEQYLLIFNEMRKKAS